MFSLALASVCGFSLGFVNDGEVITHCVIDSRDTKDRFAVKSPITAGAGFQTAYYDMSEPHPAFITLGFQSVHVCVDYIFFPLVASYLHNQTQHEDNVEKGGEDQGAGDLVALHYMLNPYGFQKALI